MQVGGSRQKLVYGRQREKRGAKALQKTGGAAKLLQARQGGGGGLEAAVAAADCVAAACCVAAKRAWVKSSPESVAMVTSVSVIKESHCLSR